MPCDTPSYPPSTTESSGGWGNSWGGFWSDTGWYGAWCMLVEFTVPPPLSVSYSIPPPLDIQYPVPTTNDISYDVIYASPSVIDYPVPPSLVIEYKVIKLLDITYDVPISRGLVVEFSMPDNLGVSYDVLTSSPIDIDFNVSPTALCLVDYATTAAFPVDYQVPAVSTLDLSFGVPAWAKSLVVSYQINRTAIVDIEFPVISSTYRSSLNASYSTDVNQVYKTNSIAYSVYNSTSTTGPTCAMNQDGLFSGVFSIDISSQEGALSFSATVSDSHPWAGVSVGDFVEFSISGRFFKFKVKKKGYNARDCVYRIDGSVTVDDILDRSFDPLSAGVYAEDPVRKVIEEDGYICINDIEQLRNSANRPTVVDALKKSIEENVGDYVLDAGIPGMDDLVPFDFWYGEAEISAPDVINSLIGWSKPYIFISDRWGIKIIGGWPTNARAATPPPTSSPNLISSEDILVSLPKSVVVNGEAWPKAPESDESDGDCGTQAKDPSEKDDYEYVETFKTRIEFKRAAPIDSHQSLSVPVPDDYNVAEKVVVHYVRKKGGVVVYEKTTNYFEVWVPIIIDAGEFTPSSVYGYKKKRLKSGHTEVFYEYVVSDGKPCKDGLLEKRTVEYRSPLSLDSDVGLLDVIRKEIYYANTDPFLYRIQIEKYDWSPKGYLRKKVVNEIKASVITVGTPIEVKYTASSPTIEKWMPLGDGMWFHSLVRGKESSIFLSIQDSAKLLDEYGVPGQNALSPEVVAKSEITINGPDHSDCVASTGECGDSGRVRPSCDSTSSADFGLTKYTETVNIPDGEAPGISISVPGINLYSPISKDGKTDPGIPPMNIGSDYAIYASRSRLVVTRQSYQLPLGAGQTIPMAGDFIGGGLVVDSRVSVSGDGINVEYTIVFLRGN